MKKYILLVLVAIISFSTLAQNKQTKSADDLASGYDYYGAIEAYLTLVRQGNNDLYIKKQLADCYYYIDNFKEAEKWYAQSITSQKDAEVFFRYAQVLKANLKYKEANIQLQRFAQLSPNDSRAQKFGANPNYLDQLERIDAAYEIRKLNINSARSDWGATLYGDVLYFVSARNESKKVYSWNNEPFLDIYQAKRLSNGNFEAPEEVAGLNSDFHEGSVSLTKSGSIAYFTSESFKNDLFKKDKSRRLKFGQVSLYSAKKENDKWTAIAPFPWNNKSYSNGNPSVNGEGTVLYFASDMPGSIGGTDIWKVQINADGSYGQPENLGPSINTAADENFPFIADNDVLYFASNGLLGYGGFDVFSVNALEAAATPKNLGKPVNSEKDDFSFTFNTEKNIAFLSSNRTGQDDIYVLNPICKSNLMVAVKNAKDGAALASTRVEIVMDGQEQIVNQMSDDKGILSYDMTCGKSYKVRILKDGYVTQSKTVIAVAGSNLVEVALEPIEVIVTETEIILNPIYFYSNRSEITEKGAAELDKLVYVMSQNQKLQIDVVAHTDHRGTDSYNLKLSENRAKATVAYIIEKGIGAERISGKGMGEGAPKIDCKENCTELEMALNRRSEFLIRK
ncbi:OmpA family protein [Flavobacterium turcicum]|uniref:OmpA family protein n=1 Tax=Flavobacterium turcicum TaxID=2764718 RepID=A0ABR7JIL9_9FLAO|nr:OmpA family protein [Flavobacterium turcicum]MBC5864086.1 OmpA family protein [Flavobacterium turcicum]NHL02992.1 OmpA family protein [Flavobacterium turcicum]